MDYATVKKLRDVDAAWLAGIIDGEGCVTLTTERKRQKFKNPQVCVSNTSLKLLEEIKELTGVGHIRKKPKRVEHHKQAWSWQIKTGRQVLDLLEQLLPHMREE